LTRGGSQEETLKNDTSHAVYHPVYGRARGDPSRQDLNRSNGIVECRNNGLLQQSVLNSDKPRKFDIFMYILYIFMHEKNDTNRLYGRKN
jgi:hypothetical protein